MQILLIAVYVFIGLSLLSCIVLIAFLSKRKGGRRVRNGGKRRNADTVKATVCNKQSDKKAASAALRTKGHAKKAALIVCAACIAVTALLGSVYGIGYGIIAKNNPLQYKISDNEIEITKFFSVGIIDKVVIPSSIDGYPVTAIGAEAFKKTKAKSITIPDTVRTIGNDAFKDCDLLKYITIPDSVTIIGMGAFSFCGGLTAIEIPNSVISIGSHAFEHCKELTDVTLPDGLASIENFVFLDCRALTSIQIPNSVTAIGSAAFMFCRALTEITIPGGMKSIGSYAFADCRALTSITTLALAPPKLYNNVFLSVAKDAKIYVPVGRVGTYKAVGAWNDYEYRIFAIA
ncbi:MAG: leucine-rich repeat domain-containing protein [Clostridiales bacterium]|jgi:hypothetical protein|nr:leucine-rich repeat domain-containing protein [Clostridiales bacterium]